MRAGAACPSTTYTCTADSTGHGAWLKEGTHYLFEEAGKGEREGTVILPLTMDPHISQCGKPALSPSRCPDFFKETPPVKTRHRAPRL